jgi:hypothetical protein
MKDKISKPDQVPDLAQFEFHQLVPYSPFVPMIDLSYAFTEMKVLIKRWTVNKREYSNTDKNKIHENI